MQSAVCSARSIVTSELSPLPEDWFVACAATAAAAPPAPPAAAPVAAPPPAAPPSLQAAAQLHLISQSSAGRHAVPLAPSLLLPSKEQEFPLRQSGPIAYLLDCHLLAPLVAPRKLGEGRCVRRSPVAGQLCRHREEQGQEAGGDQGVLRSTPSHLASPGLRLLAPCHPFQRTVKGVKCDFRSDGPGVPAAAILVGLLLGLRPGDHVARETNGRRGLAQTLS